MAESQSSLLSFVSESPSSSSSFRVPDPIQCEYDGLQWLRADLPDRIRKGAKVSKIWDFGNYYHAVSDDNRPGWKCALCRGPLVVSMTTGNTSNIIRHLSVQHNVNVFKATSIAALPIRQQSSILYILDVPAFRKNLLAWVVTQQHAFDEVENKYFQGMLMACNSSVAAYLVESGSTIKNWLMEEFVKAKAQVVRYLGMALSRIHISFDLWTSPNGYALCGVIGHFVDSTYQVQHCLLGLHRMEGNHEGTAIADAVVAVILQYEIQGNLGVFISDNDPLNDVATKAISHQLKLTPTWYNRRARCFGHVINLAAKGFLFGRDTKAFEAIAVLDEDEGLVNSEALKLAQNEWRKQGPVGKVHNIVVYVRRSIERREQFKRCRVGDDKVDDLSLLQDNATRWNSTLNSIERAILLRYRIAVFCSYHSDQLGPDILTDDDWDLLNKIAIALVPFRETTARLEGHAHHGHHGSVWEVLPVIEALLPIYEAGRQDATAHRQGVVPTPLEVAYHTAWKKLDKYYKKIDETHQIYGAAILLYPQYRKHYFQNNWKDTWTRTMIAAVKRYWKEAYQHLDQLSDEVDTTTSPPRKRARHGLDFLDKHLAKTPAITAKATTEFDAYITAPAVELAGDDAVFSWLRRASRLPTSIQQMCFDLLSIPAMSAEVERVFSITKRKITADRNRLHNDTVEVLELLKYWWDHDIVAAIAVE